MKSFRSKKDLTIESIRLELLQKNSSWISNRFNTIDNSLSGKVFIPSKRYLQSKVGNRQEFPHKNKLPIGIDKFKIERMIAREQEEFRRIKRQMNYIKEGNEISYSIRKSKTAFKVEKINAINKSVEVKSQIFIKSDLFSPPKQSGNFNRRKFDRNHSNFYHCSTQTNQDILSPSKMSLLLTPLHLQIDLPQPEQDINKDKEEKQSKQAKSKKIELRSPLRLDKFHKKLLKPKETQIAPWRSSNLDSTLDLFAGD